MTQQSQVHSAKHVVGKSVRGGGTPSSLGEGVWAASSGNFLKSKTVISAFSCNLKQHFGGVVSPKYWHSLLKKKKKSTNPVELDCR